jgi:hypothetical protein
MTDLGSFSSISRRASAPPPTARRPSSMAPRPVTPPSTRAPYAGLVGILSIASTSIALFDLYLFAAGLSS